MANHETNADEWVDDRLASLSHAGEWRPNAGAALSRLQQRRHARRAAARRWILGTMTASVAIAAMLLVPASRACAQQPGACVRQVLGVVLPERVVQPAAPQAVVNGPEQRSFREEGSATAAIGVEIYADYECPPCAAFFRDVVPSLTEQYVRTGKVKLLHRDFPLPSHRFAELAARYADAAGERGYYQLAVKQIFRTQPAWKETGDIDTELAKVLPPGVMQAVRGLIAADPKLDEMLAADLAQARLDHLNQTPSVVIVRGGKRQVVAGALSFALLKSYLDSLEQ